MENEYNAAELDALTEAFISLSESLMKVTDNIIQLIKSAVNYISEIWDALLLAFAPSGKWAAYLHSKKRRTRMKYRKRLTTLLIQEIGGLTDE